MARAAGTVLIATFLLALGAGCAASDGTLAMMVSRGDHGRARLRVQSQMSRSESDRAYLLDRMRLGIVTLADGDLPGGEAPFEEAYDKLRTQGVNDDKTLAIAMVGDTVTFWKGEPFEQAMAFHYVGLWHAMHDDWGNTRAAAGNALFHLKDFGRDATGRRADAETIIRTAAEWDRDEDRDDYLETGYVAVESNFALGYLMNGIANRQLGRAEEARDSFRAAVAVNRSLGPLTSRLEAGDYNTLLVVDFGVGPEKYARGRDNAIADFRPRMPNRGEPLLVTANGVTEAYPAVCDLDRLAADHMWKGVEDIRIAKSRIGSVLVGVGVMVAAHSNSDGASYAGLGLILAGLFQRATAQADTTYCEVLPQRVYVAPVDVRSDSEPIELQVEGARASKLVLRGLGPPAGGQAQLRYVRLVTRRGEPPGWASSGEIHYCNDQTPEIREVHLPYILGGSCVCTPSEETLASCQEQGLLVGMTPSGLAELYHLEGITITARGEGNPGLHVLEGGRSLYTPYAGTAGFSRLFGQRHRPYKPRSPEVRALARKIRSTPGLANSTSP